MNLPVAKDGSQAIDVARKCALDARRIIRAARGETRIASTKGRGNVATDADFAIERVVRARLGRSFPEHAIMSEETGADTRSRGWMWVVDPLDGTKNFSRGIPHYCFSIALCHDNQPQVGLIHHPVLNETYLAERGRGATLNGAPMRVSGLQTVRESVVAIDMGYDDVRAAGQIALAARLWPGMQALRVAGSAALGLAFVAAGRWDLFVHMDLRPWDSAAGILLVEEAGGVVTSRDGGPATIFSTGLVASTPGAHADFMKLASGSAGHA